LIRLNSILAGCLALAISAKAGAEPPRKLDTDVYGRLANIELMQLSPAGDQLSYIQVNGDNRALVVKDLAGKTILDAPLGDNKIRSLVWAGAGRLLITTSAAQRFTGGSNKDEWDHTYVIHLDGRKAFEVFGGKDTVMATTFGYYGAVERSGHWYGYFGGVPMRKTRGFEPTMDENNFISLFKVDLDSGEASLIASGEERSHNWALDADGRLVAQSEYDEPTGRWTLRADGPGGRVLSSITTPLHEVGLAGLGRAAGTVIVDKEVPEEFTTDGAAHTVLVGDRLIEGYIDDPTSRRLVGVDLYGDRPEQRFFDPVLAARQAAFAKALGGHPLLISWSADFKRMILFTEGDGDAGTYWLFDGKAVKPYGYLYPDLPDANVGARTMITYQAADGLELRGVLTLPPGRAAKGLPLVVMPHGGPQGHDDLDFDWLAEAFAGRGYAVFQPNFRGSDGQGKAFRDAGFGQWGRKMQTDISDGVAELARRGVIDPKRACIVGASYGGYAALAGVTVQQGLYRCAVSDAGISDLNDFLEWKSPTQDDDRDATTRYLRRFVGARGNDDPTLHALSPARLAARADAPILLIHGADDSVVPLFQSRKMEEALRKAGKPVEFVLLKGEDHWLSRDATRKAMLKAAVDFVEAHDPAD
jgi:dipeptidyl aminopeptidase/acylaminoacyl peptidase